MASSVAACAVAAFALLALLIALAIAPSTSFAQANGNGNPNITPPKDQPPPINQELQALNPTAVTDGQGGPTYYVVKGWQFQQYQADKIDIDINMTGYALFNSAGTNEATQGWTFADGSIAGGAFDHMSFRDTVFNNVATYDTSRRADVNNLPLPDLPSWLADDAVGQTAALKNSPPLTLYYAAVWGGSITNVDFATADLTHMIIEKNPVSGNRPQLTSVSFAGAKLDGTSFSSTDMKDVVFANAGPILTQPGDPTAQNAQMTLANNLTFSDVTLVASDPAHGAAMFLGTVFEGVTTFTSTSMTDIKFSTVSIDRDANTKVPKGFTFVGGNFTNCDLHGLDLSDPNPHDWANGDTPPVSLDRTVFTDTTVAGAVFDNVSMVGVQLIGTDGTADLIHGTSFEGANLTSAVFGTVDQIGMVDADFAGALLDNASFQGAQVSDSSKFDGASMVGANLQGADFTGVNLSGLSTVTSLANANLQDANLQLVDLSGLDLHTVNLAGADLRGANLRGVDLTGVDLSTARLEGADLRGAKLAGATLPPIDPNDPYGQPKLDMHTTFDTTTFGGGWVFDNLDGFQFKDTIFEDAEFKNADGAVFDNVMFSGEDCKFTDDTRPFDRVTFRNGISGTLTLHDGNGFANGMILDGIDFDSVSQGIDLPSHLQDVVATGDYTNKDLTVITDKNANNDPAGLVFMKIIVDNTTSISKVLNGIKFIQNDLSNLKNWGDGITKCNGCIFDGTNTFANSNGAPGDLTNVDITNGKFQNFTEVQPLENFHGSGDYSNTSMDNVTYGMKNILMINGEDILLSNMEPSKQLNQNEPSIIFDKSQIQNSDMSNSNFQYIQGNHMNLDEVNMNQTKIYKAQLQSNNIDPDFDNGGMGKSSFESTDMKATVIKFDGVVQRDRGGTLITDVNLFNAQNVQQLQQNLENELQDVANVSNMDQNITEQSGEQKVFSPQHE